MTAHVPVGDRPRETALIVVVPEALGLVDDFRRRFDGWGYSRRIPPHVTVLYPFVDAEAVDLALLSSLGELYAGVEPFEFELARLDRFDEYVWLAPEPRARFADLIELTCAGYPEHPPYGGAFPEPTPHLTIGETDDGTDIAALAAAAVRELGDSLPLTCTAREVTLLEEQPDGTWAARTAFPFGGRRP